MIAASHSSFLAYPVPVDFEERFVRLGRLQCETHYSQSRIVIDAWLREFGKKQLLAARAQHVRTQARNRLRPCPVDFAAAFPYLGLKGCRRRYRTSGHQVNRWIDECGREKLLEARRRYTGQRDPARQINLIDMGQMISRALPVDRPNLKTAPDTIIE